MTILRLGGMIRKMKGQMKGQARMPMGMLVAGILGIAVLGLLFYITFFKVEPIAEHTEWKTTCQESVRNHALFKFGEFKSKPPIKCPILDVMISDELGNKEGQEKAKKRIAEVMKECWGDIYNNGKYELFEGEKIFCGACAIIKFDDENQHIGHFTEYLAETNVPGRQISYLDYFAGYETAQFREFVNDPKVYDKGARRLEEELDSNKEYGVVFVYARGEEKIAEFAQALGTQTVPFAFGLGVAEGGVIATGVIILLGSNPVGWVSTGIIGTGALVVGFVRGAIEYFKEKPNIWLATINLVEWREGVLQDMKCEEGPIVIAE